MASYHQVFFSPTGSTELVIKTIAASISDDFVQHNLTSFNSRKMELILEKEDFLIVGIPVYSGHLPKLIEDTLKRIKGNKTPVVLVATYGNRDYDYAIEEMRVLFTKNSFVPISTACFIGEHSYTDQVATGRPDSSDLLLAKEYGDSIKQLLSQKESFDEDYQIYKPIVEIPPAYQSLPLAPIRGEGCIACGVCKEVCPSMTILSIHPNLMVEENCIRCHACVKKCPQSVIYFDDRLSHVRKRLIDQCGMHRKEPELNFLVSP